MKLRLGPLPRTEIVKVTISMSAALKAQLDRYAAAHSRVWEEQVDAPTLIPHMLAHFVQRDRAFKVLSKLADHPTPDASAD
jgi:hypothetical protein